MTVTIATPTSEVTNQSVLANRFILTEVERLTLVFPAVWVAEILRIERTQILDLPFYNPLLVGIVNHSSRIVPLIAAAKLLDLASFSLRERLLVVRLNETAGKFANVGIIVDRAIGSTTRDLLPQSLFDPDLTTDRRLSLLQPESLPTDLWQPQRWN
jgi:chemotaxis signal transduction protein